MTKYYPMFVDLSKHKCLLIGGGKVALRKLKQILACGGRVTVISPEFVSGFEKYSGNPDIKLIKREYIEGDLDGFSIAIASTDREEVNNLIRSDANKSNTLVNVVDKPELCDFIVPSLVERGSLKIAVSTEGKSPALAGKIREKLESDFPEEYETYVEILGKGRERIKEIYPESPDIRMKIGKKLLELPILDMILKGQKDKALNEMERMFERIENEYD